jgi:ribonuclease Z
VVFEANGVKVTAFAVNHGPLIRPACGYRAHHGGRSVLISGDTKLDEAVVRHGTGFDLLIHDVCEAPAEVLDKLQNRAVMEHHTSAEEAGSVFSRAKPKLAAYTHIIQLTANGASLAPDVAQIEAATRKTYSGPLVVGEDLMRFVIGDTVTVRRWDGAKQSY